MLVSCIPFMQSWVELIGVASVLVGAAWALLTWRADVKKDHAAVFAELIATFSSQDMFSIFDDLIAKEYLQPNSLSKNGKDGDGDDQRTRLDRLLMFFNEICYLKANEQIGDTEFSAFVYPIRKTVQNKGVSAYLAEARERSDGMFMYDALMEYCDRIESGTENAHKYPVVMDDDALVRHLLREFGSMTESAKSVKARIHTVMGGFNCEMDELVKTQEITIENIKTLSEKFPTKSKAQVSSFKNAIKHCFKAKTGIWLDV